MTKTVNVSKWVQEHKSSFSPPVCNKLMHGDQLKVMFVGGPNSRKDYHLEEGEELFYQLQGDMNLRVVENGVQRDQIIKEGHIYLLPGRTFHSPQRFADTVGLVVERLRTNRERDALTYFVDDTSLDIIWQRWFHCANLVKDLPPVIQEWNASKAKASGVRAEDSFSGDPPAYEAITTGRLLERPFELEDWIESKAEEFSAKPGTCIPLFDPSTYVTSVYVHGQGRHKIEAADCAEVFLWLLKGNAEADGVQMFVNDSTLVKNRATEVEIDPNSFVMSVCMPTA